MSFLVSKKYVDALTESFDDAALKEILEDLENLATLFKNQDFANLMNSPELSLNHKSEVILKFITFQDKKFKNFLKILIKNKRITLVQELTKLLKARILKKENISLAKLYTSYDLTESELNSLKDKFSKKFDTNIELEVVKSNIGGLKVEFETLAYEINLSMESIKIKIKNHILKAI